MVALASVGGSATAAASVATSLSAADKRELQREARLIIDLLENYHYAERSFRELEGAEIVTRFLDTLDPRGSVLTQADGEFMVRRFGRSLKTVYLVKGDVQPAFEIFDYFVARSQERLDWIDERLTRPFDFAVEETLPPARDEEPPADRAAADRRWNLRLKHELIAEMLDGQEFDAAVAAVRKNYRQLRRQFAAMDALTVREQFLEALVNLFDPHSGYFSADTAHEFEVEMEGAVGGVGLDLRKAEGRCVVDAVRAGGPAETQGEIVPGDEVRTIAIGDAAPFSTATRRLREIVALLRGAPGTQVRLMIIPADAAPDDPGRGIELVRARVILPEERARGKLVTVPGADGRSHRIGWIDLPSFYAAGEDAQASSATRDVRELIEAMQARGLEALVIDERKNPGGAITEAVSLTGLFIPEGTVMATRALDGTIAQLKTGPAPVAFGGPLVVLTSPNSASASEVFAGALRYHRRALVVGGATTFGKGTVQNYLDLEKMPVRGTGGPPWGLLRLTAQQFFFPDGASVQLTGAASHIVLPDVDALEERHEADLPHALRAETIALPGAAPATGEFARVTEELVTVLRARLDERVNALPEFSLAKQRRELLTEMRAEREISLVLERRREERDERDTRARALRRARWTLANNVRFPAEPVDTTEVRAAIETQEATMRPRLWPEGGAGAGRLFGHRYWFIDAQDHLGSVNLDDVPYRDLVADAEVLAAAFAEASGLMLDGNALAAALRAAHVLEHKSERALRACFASQLSGAPDAGTLAAVARGVDVVLRRAAEIDGSWVHSGPVLDVGAREALRLALDWLDRQAIGVTSAAEPPMNIPTSAP